MWKLPLSVHSRIDSLGAHGIVQGAALHFAWVYFLWGDVMWLFVFVGFGGFFW